MIRYSNEQWWGYAQYFHFFGSAIFTSRTLPQAFIGGAIGWWATQNSDEVRDVVLNPTAYFSAISLVLGFLLVFRTQLSYGRYWEGRTAMQVLNSKLEDVAIHTKTFVQRTDREATVWKARMGQALINFFTLAIADLRGEEELNDVLEQYDGFLDLTPTQIDELQASNYRTYHILNEIVDQWVVWSLKGGVAVPPPIQSRTYQIISEAQLAFNAAQKIQSTPFPYPLMQVCGMLLHVYMLTGPLVIGAFLKNPAFGTFLSTASVLGFFALNKTAEELEDPFGSDPNDLPLDSYLATFRQSLFAQGIMRGQKKGWAAVKIGMKLDTTEAVGNAVALTAMGAKAVDNDQKRTEHTAQKVEKKAKERGTDFWDMIGLGLVTKAHALNKEERMELKELSFYHLS